MGNFQSFDDAASRRYSYALPSSLVELLREKSRENSAHVIYTFLPDGEHEGPTTSFASLDQKARSIAAVLQTKAKEGERALLVFPPGLEFIDAFFGCLYSGLIAVPAFPPNPAQREQSLSKMQALAYDARASLILTTRAVQSLFQPFAENYPPLNHLEWVAIDQIPDDAYTAWNAYAPDPDRLAYFQYTSGSTRNPHGVCLTHRNLVHNSARIGESFQLTSQDVSVSWLPVYHNLGLVGTLLQPFFSEMRAYLMSPQTFLENPLLWLKAITRFKGTVCGGPNFAYDLCVQRIPPQKREGLDLSSWVLAFNGAEPIHAETLKRFAAAYAPYGFPASAFYPCYGLAEATLMVTGGKRTTGSKILRVDPAALEANLVRVIADDSQEGQSLVSSGRGFSDQELLIVDPDRNVPLGPGQVGELWIKGPSVSPGYWNHPDETEQTFKGYLASADTTGADTGPYLRTGDLGFLQDQECYITGRLKELIIIRGRNLYPQDIEQSVLPCHPALIPHGAAAFSIQVEGEEKLAIVQEVDRQKASDLQEITAAMRQAITAAYNVQLYAVALVEQGTIARTISGKIQRRLTCKQYLESTLKSIYTNVIRSAPSPQVQPVTEAQPRPTTDSLLHSALVALGPEKAGGLIEAFLRTRISQILQITESSLAIDQPLSSLGLDSISTIELAESIQTTIGIRVSLDKITGGSTLADLVKLIAEQFSATAAPSAPAVTGTPASTVEAPSLPNQTVLEYPLSYGQRALWFVQRLHPEDIAHNIVYAISMHTALDPEVFRRATQKLVLRHPILRTCFFEIDGQPVQRVYPDSEHFDFTVVDATNWNQQQFDERLNREVFTPFDLETGPLVRCTLLKKGPQETIVALGLHHIITDLWSMAMIAHDLIELYAADAQQRDPVLKTTRETFFDAIRREAEMLTGPEGEKHLDYWKERLTGEKLALLLPTDHPRPAVLSGRAASRSIGLEPGLIASLKSLADKHNTTLFTELLSAFYVLIYRYTGQTDFLLATPKAMRNRQNATATGYFINPVILRASFNETLSFADLLEQTNREVTADFQHDAYPFPLLVEHLQPSRSLGGNPLFQVFFSWQKTHRMMDSRLITALAMNEACGPFDVSGVPVSTIPMNARVTSTDLALLVAESEGELRLTVEYSTDLFEAQTIDRMLWHMNTLLNAAVRNPSEAINRLPLLTAAEHHQILHEWNTPRGEPTVETTFAPVHAAILRQADNAPDSIAVEAGAIQLTYQELANRACTLAARLSEMGAGPGKIVGLCMDRTPEMLIGLLAVLQRGSTFLPLDPDYPQERLAFMLADSRAAFLLTKSWLVDRLPGTDIPVLCLDRDINQTETITNAETPQIQPDDIAYIMYTSGSTGQPKGVLVPHRAIARHCRFMQTYYHMTPLDRMLQFASLNFDASLEQIFTPLMTGATLVLRDNNLWDPGEFSQKIADLALTIVNIPPAYWEHWTAAERETTGSIQNPQLRLVIIGGDVMLPETLHQWHHTRLGTIRLVNAYGPTEAIITATAFEVPPEPIPAGSRVPIGRPLAGRTAYILNNFLQPVPVGIPGELFIGGECLAQGYWNRTDLTQEKFIQDPFNPAADARLYRTGDLACFRADGNIEFLGRVDRQIKILGIRIEPGEIEAVLQQHPEITNAVVLHTPGPAGRLTACVCSSSQQLKPADLSTFLSRRLPQYMIPGDIVILDDLPLTPSGKLDRDALALAVTQSKAGSAESRVLPRNEIEAYLAELWEQLLCVEKVGVRDNFFALGGHSLLATQVMARVCSHYKIEIPLRDLFEGPTVENLARAVVQALSDQEDEEDLDALINEIEDL